MQITIDFQNNSVAQKVLWFLEHLKNDGVKIVSTIPDEQEQIDNDLKTLQIVAMSSTWDNTEDEAWDAL